MNEYAFLTTEQADSYCHIQCREMNSTKVPRYAMFSYLDNISIWVTRALQQV